MLGEPVASCARECCARAAVSVEDKVLCRRMAPTAISSTEACKSEFGRVGRLSHSRLPSSGRGSAPAQPPVAVSPCAAPRVASAVSGATAVSSISNTIPRGDPCDNHKAPAAVTDALSGHHAFPGCARVRLLLGAPLAAQWHESGQETLTIHLRLVEEELQAVVDSRTESLVSLRELGPPDLVHLTKQSSKSSTKQVRQRSRTYRMRAQADRNKRSAYITMSRASTPLRQPAWPHTSTPSSTLPPTQRAR